MRGFISALLLSALVFSACSDSNITKIKEGFLDIDKSVNIGYVLESYKGCEDLSYSTQNEEGKDYVIAVCDVSKTAKKALLDDYEHFTKSDYLVTANYLKPFVDNVALFEDMKQEFIFLINKDGSYALDNIVLKARLEGKELRLNANDKKAFMSIIYKDKTLVNDKGIANYAVHFQNFIQAAPEFSSKFGLDIKNPLPLNERINASAPFGLRINQTDLKEAFKLIPCTFEECKFVKGIFEKNGYYISYDNCPLAENMLKLWLGFDDEQRLVYVQVQYDEGRSTNYKIRQKFAKEGAKALPVREDTFFSQKFRFEVPETKIFIEGQDIRFDTFLEYADKDFFKKMQAVLKENAKAKAL